MQAQCTSLQSQLARNRRKIQIPGSRFAGGGDAKRLSDISGIRSRVVDTSGPLCVGRVTRPGGDLLNSHACSAKGYARRRRVQTSGAQRLGLRGHRREIMHPRPETCEA